MTLLTSMLERPLDPGYQAAADARTAAGLPASTSWRTPRLLAFLLVIGLLVGVAAADLRGREGSRAIARAALVERIQQRQQVVDERTESVRALQAEVDAIAARVDPASDEAGASRLESWSVADGSTAVTGPGLRVQLDDADGESTDGDGDPRTTSDATGRVQSRDLQIVVNALWAAGAEAVSVNGQRLTSRSAIRFAGEAILVNFRPLTRPYVIEAVGDPTAMQTALARGPGGVYLSGLTTNYGIPTSVTTADELTLPSAVTIALRDARPAGRPATDRSTSPSSQERS